jgi:hypothetical protein
MIHHGRREPSWTRIAPGTWTEKTVFLHACVREWQGALQTFRESEQVFQRIQVPGPGSCTVAACQPSHLVTKGHDVVLQLFLSLDNVVFLFRVGFFFRVHSFTRDGCAEPQGRGSIIQLGVMMSLQMHRLMFQSY